MTELIFVLVVSCVISLLIVAILFVESITRQRPLSSYTKEELDSALGWVPEHKSKFITRGTISRSEFKEMLNLSIERKNKYRATARKNS